MGKNYLLLNEYVYSKWTFLSSKTKMIWTILRSHSNKNWWNFACELNDMIIINYKCIVIPNIIIIIHIFAFTCFFFSLSSSLQKQPFQFGTTFYNDQSKHSENHAIINVSHSNLMGFCCCCCCCLTNEFTHRNTWYANYFNIRL